MTAALFALIVFGVSLNATAQILLKKGLLTLDGGLHLFRLITSPYVLAGLACYVVSVGVWLVVLSRTEVSVAYPLLSLGYIVTAVAGIYFLGEHVTALRWVGIGVIMIGVYIVSKSAA